MVEAPVIQVDGPAGRDLPVRDAHLRMGEPGRVLVDLNARTDQLRAEGFGHPENELLVRNPRNDDPNVHAAPRCQSKGARHLICDDEVGGHKPAVLPGIGEHVEVDIFPDLLPVHGLVRIGLDKPVLFRLVIDLRQILLLYRLDPFSSQHIPVFEEGDRHAPHRVARDLHPGILPVSVGLRHMKILVGQVVAAREGNLPVDHRDLPVVPVIHEEVDDRDDRVEDAALDAVRLHALLKDRVDEADAPQVVVEEADQHPLGGLLLKDRADPGEGLAVLDRVVLHENEFLRPAKLLLQILEGLQRVRMVDHVRILPDRVLGVFRDVAGLVGKAPVDLREGGEPVFISRQIVKDIPVDLRVAALHVDGRVAQAVPHVEEHAEDRQGQHDDDPGHLDGGRTPLHINRKRKGDPQDRRKRVDPGIPCVQDRKIKKQPESLQKDRKKRQRNPKKAVAYLVFSFNRAFFSAHKTL